MKKLIQRLSPPGMRLTAEKAIVAVCWSLSTIWAVGTFITNYLFERSFLFHPEGDLEFLRGGIPPIPSFAALTEGASLGFYTTALIISGFTTFRFLYFIQGSKSIYLIRRLPQRTALFKQTAALPLLGIAVTWMIFLVLTGMMIAVYLLATPKSGLPAEPFKDVWEVFACWKLIS